MVRFSGESFPRVSRKLQKFPILPLNLLHKETRKQYPYYIYILISYIVSHGGNFMETFYARETFCFQEFPWKFGGETFSLTSGNYTEIGPICREIKPRVSTEFPWKQQKFPRICMETFGVKTLKLFPATPIISGSTEFPCSRNFPKVSTPGNFEFPNSFLKKDPMKLFRRSNYEPLP